MTKAGIHNVRNLSKAFGCPIFSLKPEICAQKKIIRLCFERWGKPTWLIARLIYMYPLHLAKSFGLPLLVYGENINYEYGVINAPKYLLRQTKYTMEWLMI